MVLLITGAIAIKGSNVPSTLIVDVDVRLSQYLDSIDYAISHYETISEIVFCENTNFIFNYKPLQEKALKYGKKLEIVSFNGDYLNIQKKGKGYGEGEIIRYALNNSEILLKCDFFYKLTGRLIVKNMDKIVFTTNSDNSFIYHPKTIYKIPKDHIETFFYKVNKKLYLEHLADAYEQVEESIFQYLEHIFYKRLSSHGIRSFRYAPLLSGFSGTSGESYDLGTKTEILERINYFIGVPNLKKTISERLLTRMLSYLIKIMRLIK